MALQLQQAQFQRQKQILSIEQLAIQMGDFWAVAGGNGSGKTLFSQSLAGNLPLVSGQFTTNFAKVALSSFESQQKIIEAIFNARNNDAVSPDDFGLTAREIILSDNKNRALCDFYIDKLKITQLLDRPFIQLSTGESRKVLLCQLLVSEPDLLILDEPFEGLDQQSVQEWLALLAELQPQMALVLIVNRLNDIPDCATHLALLDNLSVILQGERADIEQDSVFQQLVYAEQAVVAQLPASVAPTEQLPVNIPPFDLKEVTIQYGDKLILDKLSWTVSSKEHWWIKGPNGAGKSTLLAVLSGEHPQSFANHVILFGKQRGSGETIWDIKKHIGYVSSQLHMDYRVNCSVRDVILSGFFDSIGVYQKVSEALRLKADEWLARLNFTTLANKPFRSLSWGQQRLLIITRAMVKHPPILILDEPLQGLDGINRKLVKQFIDQLVQNSQTQLLFVSHQDQDAPDCITHLFEFVPKEQGYQYVKRRVNG
ncbi:molybdate ABC transporter ATP-binding protein ModF [Vespertiliibacter pulmonis]|uniref:Molybdate transport system ATP-binding protein n=1 Tax=Vespertiliibacter pulmonis TaxID=1443036 RepID=A0A3N4VK45_9PAST|nr:molybdate ABC transporter ATP-binding protein ModF [Vespertiliibacter pulmonis]QLB20825.1 molybdate ABC transporter ATP-binding protein ModF [Vespertiliibacter pulmonis]RPE83476.1 molybdate transport system ATP-binding protein [Vespertiliibacter pulmonis]